MHEDNQSCICISEKDVRRLISQQGSPSQTQIKAVRLATNKGPSSRRAPGASHPGASRKPTSAAPPAFPHCLSTPAPASIRGSSTTAFDRAVSPPVGGAEGRQPLFSLTWTREQVWKTRKRRNHQACRPQPQASALITPVALATPRGADQLAGCPSLKRGRRRLIPPPPFSKPSFFFFCRPPLLQRFSFGERERV